MAAKYGKLGDAWEADLRQGFAECFRVLRPLGCLVFQWNETRIPLRDVLACTEHKPLFGHRVGRLNRTHWMTFMKPDQNAKETPMDGKWKWPLVALLYLLTLPGMLWRKLFPPKPSPMAEYLQAQQKRALQERQWNGLPVTPEEEEAWRELEEKQKRSLP
ncbi:MAG: hypothetical protein WBF88_06810 [Pusillimonas sp.]